MRSGCAILSGVMVLSLLKKLSRPLKDRAIARLPSRVFLEATVIPAFAAAGRRRMLFVGTRSYNQPAYARCVAEGISVWSIDLDPAAAFDGAPDGHIVGNICDIERLARGLSFDVVIFNGVLGWGLNTAHEAEAALKAMANAAPDALLFIGWNPGRTDDAEIAAMRSGLKHAALGPIPEVIEFPPAGRAQRYPHRYELFAFA